MAEQKWIYGLLKLLSLFESVIESREFEKLYIKCLFG
jgi:hypothetical protein